jgi:hypothetical protein
MTLITMSRQLLLSEICRRLGDLYVGGSNAARLYRRCARRRDFRRDGLRNRHREVPDTQSEQRERQERAFEAQSLNVKPHRFNQPQIAALQ